MKHSRNLNRTEKLLLILLALLMIGAFYYYFVQIPVTEAIDAANSEIDSLNTDIMILTVKNTKLSNMKKELEDISITKKTPVVPQYDNLDKIMAFLFKVLAPTENYSLSVQNAQASSDGSNIMRRSMTLRFSCSDYFEAKQAISKLQSCSLCSRVGAVTFSRSSSNESRSILEGGVDVSVSITFFERTA